MFQGLRKSMTRIGYRGADGISFEVSDSQPQGMQHDAGRRDPEHKGRQSRIAGLLRKLRNPRHRERLGFTWRKRDADGVRASPAKRVPAYPRPSMMQKIWCESRVSFGSS